MREYMEKKAAQKLLCCDRHQLLFAAVGVIFPAERHLTIGEVYEPVVGDGDAMRVACQVMKNVLRAADGGLAYTTQSWRKSVRRKEWNARSFARA